MLHPAERKLGNENDVVFRKREFVIEILFEIFDGFSVETKDLGGVRLEFGELGFANEHMGRTVRTRSGSDGVSPR